MLKDFFESPEIAAIFATKQKDKKSVDINEGSRLRVGKHSRKREHSTKRPVRSKVRGHQHNNADMFSARKSRVDNAEKIANLHERIDYFDYDDETGTIIKKKHSVFDCGSKQSSLEYDKTECDVDIKRDDFMKQVTSDFNTGGDGYYQSDSAYDTNHDDYTDSLERIMIKDDTAASGCSAIDNVSSEGNFGKPLEKRESPYRRCRSSAICGRNCEICRGKNNNILPTKYKQSKKQTVDSVNDAQRTVKTEASHQKDSNLNDRTNKKNYGMFSSKVRGKNANFHEKGSMYSSECEVTQTVVDIGDNLQDDHPFEVAKVDVELQEQLKESRTSSSAISAAGMDNFEHEEEYHTEMPYSVEHHLANNGIRGYTRELVGSADSGECADEHMLPDPGHEDEVYEAFIRGPHLIMLYDFKAEHEDDISVWKGEVVLLLDNRDRDWVWVATDTNNEGYVPRSLTAPYCYCEECRQEELGRRQALEKDEVSSNISIPRSTSTNSRSSLASVRSSTKYSADNSPLQQQREDSPIASNASQSNSDPLLSENRLDMNYTSSYEINSEANQVPYMRTYTNAIFQNQKRTSLGDPQNSAENQTNTRTNSSKSLKQEGSSLTQGQQSFEADNINSNSPRRTKTVSKQSSVRSSSSNSDQFESNSISQELMFWQEREKERMLKDSIKLVALSSYRTNEQGKLPVTAGDAIYVHLKDQKVPNWLWVYSPDSNKFGFIPESVVDQLKSSIV